MPFELVSSTPTPCFACFAIDKTPGLFMWESFSPMQENIWQIAQLFPSCSFKFINWIRSRNTKKQWPAPFFPLTSYFSPAKFAIPWLGAGQSWCLCRKAQRRLPELPSWWYRNLPEDLGELTIYHNKVLWCAMNGHLPIISPYLPYDQISYWIGTASCNSKTGSSLWHSSRDF